MIGETIKDFQIVAKLGRGGMGEVYAAEQKIVKTKVAIKLLGADVSTDTTQVQRFFNEAVAVSKIKHAGIVKIFDVGHHEGRAYLIMELLEGESLAARIARVGKLPLAEVVDIARQIAGVLAATHAAGITHRDLKPDNVIVVPDAELERGERVRVLDFGIAKLAPAPGATGMTGTSGSMGTPSYMPPELWTDAAKADARADIYALGCVMFEMCCRRPPFVAGSVGEACTMHLTKPPPHVREVAPEMPAALDALVARMLEKQPDARPALTEVIAALDGLDGGMGATLPPAQSGALDETLAPSGSHAPGAPRDTAADPHVTTTTLASAAAEKREPRARGRRGAIAIVAVGLAGAAGIAAIVHGGGDDHTPEIAASGPPATPPVTPLREPKLGLGTLAEFHDPLPSSALRSEQMWTAARDDFADACKQPNAPVRWCAARDFTAGELALLHDDTRAALVGFRAAAAADPTWGLPHMGAAAALTNDDATAALEAARTAQRLDPTSWQAVAAGARVFAAHQQFADAIQEYRRARGLAQQSAVLLGEMALIYHAAHNDAESDKIATEALAIDDGLAAVHLMRAERALERNDGKAAAVEAQRAIAIAPKYAGAHLALGDALALLHERDEAFEQYRLAFAAKDTSLPDARRAVVEAAMGKHELPPPRVPRGGRSVPTMKNNAGHAPRSHPGCPAGDPLCSGGLLEY